MCDPVTIGLSLAAGAATSGSLMQRSRAASDANRANKARSEAALEELDRQREFRETSQNILGETRENVSHETFGDSVDQAIKRRIDAADQTRQPIADAPVALRENTPLVVKDAISTAQSGARSDSDERVKALAGLFGRSDALFNQNIDQGRSGADIQRTSLLANRSAALNPYEQEIAARNAQKGPSLLADLLGLGGNVGLMAALSGGGGGAAPPTPRLKPRGSL